MTGMHPMTARVRQITLEAMRRRVMAAVRPLPDEPIPILQSRGRILAETIRAHASFPAMHKSAMDGFALRAVDVRHATLKHPALLPIVGTIPAGDHRELRLRDDCAFRIMTGAPLPQRADVVIKIEETKTRDGVVLIPRAAASGENVFRKGADMRKGQTILRPGVCIGPSQVAMLAFLDRARVRVHRRPRVGVLSTGDELGEVGRRRPRGHIPDSNRYGLIALVESAGAVPVDGGRCGDSPAQLLRALRLLARRSDFIVTSGGVSAGDFDVVKLLFHKLGGVDLYRLPMKPGRPQAFGTVSGVPFFGLPGNPVSSMVVFDVMVRPAIARMAGCRPLREPVGWMAEAACDFPRKSRQWEFPRVTASQIDDGEWRVRPVASQRSSDLKSMTDASGYVELSPTDPSPRAGDPVRYVPFVI